MKKMKKILALILVLVMVLSLAACNAGGGNDDDDEDGGKEGGNTGTFKLVEVKKLPEGVDAQYGGIIGSCEWTDDGTVHKFTNADGKFVTDKEYSGYGYNEAYPRYHTVSPVDSTNTGVFDALTGKEIIPCEAVTTRSLSARYEIFFYSTGECASGEEFYYYYDTNGNCVYFTGYGRVFDYEKGRYVPDLTITTDCYDFDANMSFIFESLDDGRVNVINAEGVSVGVYYDVEYDNDNSIFLAEDTFIDNFTSPERFLVIDKDGKTTATIEERMGCYDVLSGSDKYFCEYSSAYTTEYNRILDLTGNVVSSNFEQSITNVANDCVLTSRYDDEQYVYLKGIYKLDGTVVVPEANYYNIYVYDGYFVTMMGTDYDHGQYSLYDADGNKISQKEYDRHYGVMLHNHDDDANTSEVLFLNGTEKTIDYYVSEDHGDVVTAGNALYNKYTGKKVLDDATTAYYINGQYYVYSNGRTTIYKAV